MAHRVPIDQLIGKAYGKLKILSEANSRGRDRFVLCRCECGNEKEYRLADVKFGGSTNCGCIRKEKLRAKHTTHNLSRHPLHRVWMGIKERCYYPKHQKYERYGGRGIKVCDEWKDDFKSFYDWAMANGYKKGLEVDRHPNTDGDYEPSNCRITTVLKNRRNKDNLVFLEYNGQRKCITEWAEEVGINARRIRERIKKLGWSVEQALTIPKRINKYK